MIFNCGKPENQIYIYNTSWKISNLYKLQLWYLTRYKHRGFEVEIIWGRSIKEGELGGSWGVMWMQLICQG